MAEWRRRAIETYGLSSSLGVTIGGAAVAIAGAAFAVGQGVVQGVRGAGQQTANMALADAPAEPDPITPPPTPLPVSRPARQRVGSDSELMIRCQRCITGNRRFNHTYGRDCEGLPAAVHFARGSR